MQAHFFVATCPLRQSFSPNTLNDLQQAFSRVLSQDTQPCPPKPPGLVPRPNSVCTQYCAGYRRAVKPSSYAALPLHCDIKVCPPRGSTTQLNRPLIWADACICP